MSTPSTTPSADRPPTVAESLRAERELLRSLQRYNGTPMGARAVAASRARVEALELLAAAPPAPPLAPAPATRPDVMAEWEADLLATSPEDRAFWDQVAEVDRPSAPARHDRPGQTDGAR